jgi:iron complex outermembrane receptor protein
MTMPAGVVIVFLWLLVLQPLLLPVWANETPRNTGVLTGLIANYDTGEPVGWTSVLLVESGRSITAHEDGTYRLENIASGTYTLRTHRIGYESHTRRITIGDQDTLVVNIRLRESVFRSRAIEVTGVRANGENGVTAVRTLGGRELRQQLGRTLAETLQNEPGMAQSTMGPAPARPVLRGLSGDRLLVLEDGRTTGDISTSSPDHALAIDPINSEYIEILRGPSALIYSSNAIGGVVNVVRRQIPTELPRHFHGSASVQAESVNKGLSTGLSTYGSFSDMAVKGDLGWRTASDIQTPGGNLDNTAISNLHGGLGLSHIRNWGRLGASANIYRSSYGVPGNFEGSHPEGVKINLEREQVDLRLDHFHGGGSISRMRFDYTFSHYFHEELEYSPSREAFDIVGSEYSLFTHTLTGRFHHEQIGLVKDGIVGFYAQTSNFASGGFTFTPETNTYAAALYAWQDLVPAQRFALQTGFRADFHALSPIRQTSSAAGIRRNREFLNWSGGVRATYDLAQNLEVGASAMRTVRMPGIEELYSEGPHLPAYSFEIGNPALDEEHGYGLELYWKFANDRFGVQNSLYYNDFGNYLYPRNTGQESVRRPLPIYQFTGASAYMWGAEFQAEVRLGERLQLFGTLSYVEGTLSESKEPLPFIPPLTGKIDIQYAIRTVTLGTNLRFASAQNRLGEFEESTNAYRVFDAFVHVYHGHRNHMHTISITAENLTNETYRMHLSRVKSIMPEPGRNIKFLYRYYF